MEAYKLALVALEKRIMRLMELHQESVKDVNQLVQERDSLVKQLNIEKQETKRLQQENEALKIANTVPAELEGREEMKKRVKELMKEVDDCIAMLNK